MTDQKPVTRAFVFLFDSQAEAASYSYGEVYAQFFMESLSASDPQGETNSRILHGDAMPHHLCTRVKAVSNAGNTQSLTQGYDMELYRTIMWDLADSFSVQWNSVDVDRLPQYLHHGRTYCLVLPSAPARLGEALDKTLKKKSGYLGAVEIDLGNPLHIRLFRDFLISDLFVQNGTVWLEKGWEGTDDSNFAGSESFTPGGMQRLPYEEFHERMPPFPSATDFSVRGRLSADRFNGKSTYSIEDRVLAALAQLPSRKLPHFSFQSTETNSLLEADLPAAKFVQYLLNYEHKDGAGKAKFFDEVLGIRAQDWRYLADQFYQGLRSKGMADLTIKTWENGLGASFNCVLPIKGLNGRTANVFTNWIMKPGSLPQLSTARPESATDDDEEVLNSSNIVLSSLDDDEKWKELHRLAHESGMKAAQDCVPTPMKVEGFPVIMEGSCGSASVRVPDARRGFARWLIKSKTGSNHYKGGAEVYMCWPTQSYDRSAAYAKAYAAVLTLNGMSSTVETHID